MVMAEVNSPFGQTHNYWLGASNECSVSATAKRYTTPKAMRVSPFMDMKLNYDWILAPPGQRLVAHRETVANGQAFFWCHLERERRPWARRELHRVLAAYPRMTLGVTGGTR